MRVDCARAETRACTYKYRYHIVTYVVFECCLEIASFVGYLDLVFSANEE